MVVQRVSSFPVQSSPSLLQIPLSYVPEPVVKVTGDWLAKHPVAALSKFAVLLLKNVLEEDGVSSKGSKQGQGAAAPTGKTQVSRCDTWN